MTAAGIPALLEPIERRAGINTGDAPTMADLDRARLLAAVKAVLGEIADTDLETSEALQSDLSDRILTAVEAALRGEA